MDRGSPFSGRNARACQSSRPGFFPASGYPRGASMKTARSDGMAVPLSDDCCALRGTVPKVLLRCRRWQPCAKHAHSPTGHNSAWSCLLSPVPKHHSGACSDVAPYPLCIRIRSRSLTFRFRHLSQPVFACCSVALSYILRQFCLNSDRTAVTSLYNISYICKPQKKYPFF